MARTLLILMLMTIQLLAGSGGAVSICIGSDGSFCCFDGGPSNCSRCDTQEVQKPLVVKAEEPPRCCCGCSEIETSCEPDSLPRLEQFVESTTVFQDPCGCTQILLTHGQELASIRRTVSAAEAGELVQASFEMPALFDGDVAVEVRHCAFQRFKPPPISSHAITVLSWVLIQC